MYGSDLAYIHHMGFGGLARAAASHVLAELKQADFREGLVVDLGCGSGILASELVRSGYGVIGVDTSPAMVELARRVAPGAEFAVSPIESFDIPPCVAVCSVGECVSYLSDGSPASPETLFDRVFAALVPGGALIFDVIERADPPMRYSTVRCGPDWYVQADVSEDQAASVVTRRICTRREVDGNERESTEVHRVQTFHREDLLRMLADSGFAARIETGYAGVPVGTRRVVVTAVKPSV